MNATTLALFDIGTPEIIVIGVLGILLFGRRLPDIGRSLGKTIVEFKSGLNSAGEEIAKGTKEEPEQKKPRANLPGKDATRVKRIAGGGEEP